MFGTLGAAPSPSCEELALVLQTVVCPVGLAPSTLGDRLDSLTPLLDLQCVKAQVQGAGNEDIARAVTAVVRHAVRRLQEGVARQAADLLLGVGRTRGLPRKDRRKAAADALLVGEAHFRKRRELPLLREVAEEICALELERPPDPPPGILSSVGSVGNDSSCFETIGTHLACETALEQPMAARLQDLRVLLPDFVASFTGRTDELRWLAEMRPGSVVVTQTLAGLGGIGKTALALEYAHHCFYREHCVDLAWWFVTADRIALCAAMARVYEKLTGTPAGEDSVLAAGCLRNWLESCPYRWLVVFDNADDPRILDGLIPHAGAGQVLITSRRADWSPHGGTVRRLDVLPLDDSVALLRTITGRDDERGARLLATELDGLAVALQQAGAFIRKTGWDYGRYLEMLRIRPLSLHSEDLAGVGTTVAKVWESSVEQAVRSGRPQVSELLGVLAFLAADDIPRWLLEPSAADDDTALGDEHALVTELALVGLADYSLIRFEDDAISLHRLVQHLARARLEAAGTATDHAAKAIRLLLQALRDPASATDRARRLLSHISGATGHAIRLSVVPELVANLLNTAADECIVTGQLDVGRSLLDRALKVATARLGPDHPATLESRNLIARWLCQAGRADEAVGRWQALMEDCNRVLGKDHPGTLWVRHLIARSLTSAGRVDEAVDQFQALLNDRHRVLGPDHPDTIRTRGSLARRLGYAGRVDEAVSRLQAVLGDHRRVFGSDHRDTLKTHYSLARWLGEAGRVNEAIAQLEVVLENQRRVLGPDHRHTLKTRYHLACWLRETGNVEDAIRRFQGLAKDQRRALGADHPDTLKTRDALSLLVTATKARPQ